MPKKTILRGMSAVFSCECGFQCTSISEKVGNMKRRLHAKKCDKVRASEPEVVHLGIGQNIYNVSRGMYMATSQRDSEPEVVHLGIGQNIYNVNRGMYMATSQ
jgi:hypothetical protein